MTATTEATTILTPGPRPAAFAYDTSRTADIQAFRPTARAALLAAA